jgi:hypothetical protein
VGNDYSGAGDVRTSGLHLIARDFLIRHNSHKPVGSLKSDLCVQGMVADQVVLYRYNDPSVQCTPASRLRFRYCARVLCEPDDRTNYKMLRALKSGGNEDAGEGMAAEA